MRQASPPEKRKLSRHIGNPMVSNWTQEAGITAFIPLIGSVMPPWRSPRWPDTGKTTAHGLLYGQWAGQGRPLEPAIAGHILWPHWNQNSWPRGVDTGSWYFTRSCTPCVRSSRWYRSSRTVPCWRWENVVACTGGQPAPPVCPRTSTVARGHVVDSCGGEWTGTHGRGGLKYPGGLRSTQAFRSSRRCIGCRLSLPALRRGLH